MTEKRIDTKRLTLEQLTALWEARLTNKGRLRCCSQLRPSDVGSGATPEFREG
jgi:hypothetical protein